MERKLATSIVHTENTEYDIIQEGYYDEAMSDDSSVSSNDEFEGIDGHMTTRQEEDDRLVSEIAAEEARVTQAEVRQRREWNLIQDVLHDSSSSEEDDEDPSASGAAAGIGKRLEQFTKQDPEEVQRRIEGGMALDPPGRKKKHAKKQPQFISNDDLFYDPDLDEDDEKFMKKLRHGREEGKGPTINCPMCFTTLSRDCQRHEHYQGQFRAVFVSNCTVADKVLLRYDPSSKKFAPAGASESGRGVTAASASMGGDAVPGHTDTGAGVGLSTSSALPPATTTATTSRVRDVHDDGPPPLESDPGEMRAAAAVKMSQGAGAEGGEAGLGAHSGSLPTGPVAGAGDGQEADVSVYHPVQCSVCQTDVAVRDDEGIFHFYNVFTGY